MGRGCWGTDSVLLVVLLLSQQHLASLVLHTEELWGSFSSPVLGWDSQETNLETRMWVPVV